MEREMREAYSTLGLPSRPPTISIYETTTSVYEWIHGTRLLRDYQAMQDRCIKAGIEVDVLITANPKSDTKERFELQRLPQPSQVLARLKEFQSRRDYPRILRNGDGSEEWPGQGYWTLLDHYARFFMEAIFTNRFQPVAPSGVFCAERVKGARKMKLEQKYEVIWEAFLWVKGEECERLGMGLELREADDAEI